MAILEVIKSEAPNGLLVWKHPAEDFNTMSTLIVDESQIALFYKNGQIADIFPAGRYVLSTNNIPLLRKLIQLPTGGVSPFSCRVYFVNMAEAMNMKWGLNSRITYMEPVYNIPLELGARGTMSVSVADPASLILRLVVKPRRIKYGIILCGFFLINVFDLLFRHCHGHLRHCLYIVIVFIIFKLKHFSPGIIHGKDKELDDNGYGKRYQRTDYHSRDGHFHRNSHKSHQHKYHIYKEAHDQSHGP